MNATVAPFADFFTAVYGYAPYQWQTDVAHRIAEGRAPRNIGVDTGMGKSKIVAAWLWALAADNTPRRVPMRLHFVIDRRTVVDQVAVDGQKLRTALRESTDPRIASVAAALTRYSDDLFDVITLRGGMPTAPEHTKDAAYPTLIVSTVDMFGSRLLGRGYGVSKGRRPIDMALTGTDTLIALDEVHLAAQMVQTLADLDVQQAIDEKSVGVPGRVVVHMSATTDPTVTDVLTVNWEAEYEANPALRTRRSNRDAVAIAVDTESDIAQLAATHLPGPGQASVVFVNTVKDALAVTGKLKKTGAQVVTLVGGMPEPARHEVHAALAPFMTGAAGRADAPATIVVATQTLEAGADLDFDFGFTAACALDAFVQRLGRVNRLGLRDHGSMTVATGTFPADDAAACKLNPVYGPAAYRTAELLQTTPTIADLTVAQSTLAPGDKQHFLRPRPPVRRLPRHIFEQLIAEGNDTLAPDVAAWLRIPEQETPTLRVAFRDSLNITADEDAHAAHIRQFPVAGWEVWELTQSAAQAGSLALPKKDTRVLVAAPDGEVTWTAFETAPAGSLTILPSRTTPGVLPAFGDDLTRFRCREEAPMLLVPAPDDEDVTVLELADRHAPGVFDAPDLSAPRVQTLGDRLVVWADRLRTRAEKRERVTLAAHSADVGRAAAAAARALGLPEHIVRATQLAGERHDLGKLDPRFQEMLSAVTDGRTWTFEAAPEPLAKSGSHPVHDAAVRAASSVPAGFRHEALSVVLSDQAGYPDDVDADLVRYLIATHHGHFRTIPPVVEDPTEVTIDGTPARNLLQDPTSEEWAGWYDTALNLNGRYGPYTLALLCAIVRLADWSESARSTK